MFALTWITEKELERVIENKRIINQSFAFSPGLVNLYIIGYDQCTVPDTVVVDSTFAAFL